MSKTQDLVSSSSPQDLMYFQYVKDGDYPVYISAEEQYFSADFVSFVESMGFQQISAMEGEQIELEIAEERAPENARLLSFSLASSTVARQIEIFRPGDRDGHEGLVAQSGYKVYRYRGVGMMVISLGAQKWELGCYEDFGKGRDDDQLTPFRTMLNRYLSWALAPHGVVGFWGVPVEEGAVVLGQRQSKGEAVFFDVIRQRFLSVDGPRQLSGRFQLMRLDSTLKDRSIPMKAEQLSCFLNEHCTFMDSQGPTVPVRQMIQAVSKFSIGMIYPRENFRPRANLNP